MSAATDASRAAARWFSVVLLLGFAWGSDFARAQGQGFLAAGPVDAANGYPTFYQDRAGLALAQCLVTPDDPANPVVDPCGLAGTLPAGDGSAIVFPSNFPEEFFYWRGVGRITGIGVAAGGKGGGRADLTMGVEGAFANGPVVPGQQVVFSRFRFKVSSGLQPGATYTLTDPFGTMTFLANSAGAISFTDDQGCTAAPCAFESVLSATNTGPFLTWDATGVQPPAGYVGDPNVTHSVTGSPFGTNVLHIEGPDVGGPGINVAETNQFAVTGKRF